MSNPAQPKVVPSTVDETERNEGIDFRDIIRALSRDLLVLTAVLFLAV